MKESAWINVAEELYAFNVESTGFLLHIPTSRVFRTDDITKNIVNLLTRRASEEVVIQKLKYKYKEEKIQETIQELRDAELIGADHSIDAEIAQKAWQDKFKVNYLMLILVGDCNLRCSYCFADQGHFGNAPGFMSWEVAKACVDFTFNEPGNGLYNICFFGGEPLLNFPLIKKTVLYARKQFSRLSKNIEFSVTTNGTLLTDEICEFLNENQFGVLISIDGPQHIHDRWRRFKSGRGSHTTVAGNIQRMLSCWDIKGRKSNLMGRATVTSWEPDLTKIIPYLEGLGVPLVAAEPVSISPLEESSYALMGDSLEQYKLSFEKLVKFYRNKILVGKPCAFHVLRQSLKNIFEGQQKYYHCGAGRHFKTVAPNGDIYPCQRLTGYKDYRMGSVFTGIDDSAVKEFLPKLVTEKETCRSCWARFFCGGGCASEQILTKGVDAHPLKWSCELFKHNLKWNIWLFDEIQNADPELLPKIVGDVSLNEQRERTQAV